MTKPFYDAENFTGGKSIGYLIRRAHNQLMPRAEALFGAGASAIPADIAAALES